MSGERSALPRRWLLIATVFTLVVAGGGLALNRCTPDHPPTPPPPPPVEPIHQDQPREPEPSIDLLQLDDRGQVIPWGSAAPNQRVQLTVSAQPPLVDTRVDFVLATNVDGPYEAVQNSTPISAMPSALTPGSYWWRATVRKSAADAPVTLEHPRSIPPTPDFIILPPLAAPEHLQQTDLAGVSLAIGGTAESGVLLGATLNPSGALLEVQVTRATDPWESGETLRAGASPTGETKNQFAGDAGSYRWRARSQAKDGAVSAWHDFATDAPVHFAIVPPKPTIDNANGKDAPPEASPSMSSGGDGPSTPLRSIVPEMPSLWVLICRPWLLCAALGSLVALLAVVRRRIPPRPPTP